MSRHARVLGAADLRHVLAQARRSRTPARDTVIVLLSFKAGLRACEIAGLAWPMVLTGKGTLAVSIDLPGTITKNAKPRRVPLRA